MKSIDFIFESLFQDLGTFSTVSEGVSFVRDFTSYGGTW